MNIREIITQWLTEKGYEGLYNAECGCEIDDLMPCGAPDITCSAGYKNPCPGAENCPADGDCPWHINKNKIKGGE